MIVNKGKVLSSAKTVMLPLVLVLCATMVFSQIQLSVTTENTHVMIGEQAVVSAVIVSTKELKNLAPPQLPPSEYYTLLKVDRNQQQSSSIQVYNGRMTQTVEIHYLMNYVLSINKEGTFTFPSLSLTLDGQTYTSQPITFTAGKEQQQNQNISVNIRLSKNRLYEGEQAILTVEVAIKPNGQVQPTNEGFASIIETIEKTFGQTFSISRLFTNQVTQGRKTINGEVFQTFSLSFSVVPIKSGKSVLPSIPFQYVELRALRQRSRSVFDEFFGGDMFGGNVQQIAKSANSNRLSVDVLPLPSQPKDFSGAVGNFSLSASVNMTTVPAGEAVTLTITHKGSSRPGNMTDIVQPQIQDFEVFKPEKHTFSDTSAAGISTRKIYKYLIIPQSEGEKTIPPVTWVCFDPQSASYKTLSTEPIILMVTKGTKATKPQAERYLTQQDIQEIGRDIRYIKTPQKLTHQIAEPYKRPIFYILFPIPFVITLFLLLYRLQATLLRKDPKLLLRRRAFSSARASLNTIEKNLAAMPPTESIAKISEAMQQYISHRFGFAAVGKTLDELKMELSKCNIDTTTTEKLIPLLERLDSFRFSGSLLDRNAAAETLAQAQKLIEELERKEKR